jgi:hypothetical protein
MIKYYALEFSLNEKILGKIEQIKEINHHCNVWDEPSFIDKFPFQKIVSKPILSNPILYSASKLTDLIKVSSVGFSFGSMVISSKFKQILDNFNCFGVQFFPTYLTHKDKEINDYWQTHIFDIPYDYIDFKNTDILLKDRDKNRKLIQQNLERMENKDEFLRLVENIKYPKMIYLTNLTFNENMNHDYFFLRYFENNGSLGIVSERLKEELENADCTGIEFRPIEFSLQEWYQSGERERKYGKN